MDIRRFVKAFMLLVVFAFASVPQKIETKVSTDNIVKYTFEGFGLTILGLGVMAFIASVIFRISDGFRAPGDKAKFNSDPVFRNKIISEALDEKITHIPVDDVVKLASKFIGTAKDRATFKEALEKVAMKESMWAKKIVTLNDAQAVIDQSTVISQTNKAKLNEVFEALKNATPRDVLNSVQPRDAIVAIKSVWPIPDSGSKEGASKEDLAWKDVVKGIKDGLIKQVMENARAEIGQHPLDWALAMNKLTGGKFLEDRLKKLNDDEAADKISDREKEYKVFLEKVQSLLTDKEMKPADWQAEYTRLTKELLVKKFTNALVGDIAGAYIKLPTLSPTNQKIFDVFKGVMSLKPFNPEASLPETEADSLRAQIMDGFMRAAQTPKDLNKLAAEVKDGKVMDAAQKQDFIKNLNKFAEPEASGQRVNVAGGEHGGQRVAGSDIGGTYVDTNVDPNKLVDPTERPVEA